MSSSAGSWEVELCKSICMEKSHWVDAAAKRAGGLRGGSENSAVNYALQQWQGWVEGANRARPLLAAARVPKVNCLQIAERTKGIERWGDQPKTLSKTLSRRVSQSIRGIPAQHWMLDRRSYTYRCTFVKRSRPTRCFFLRSGFQLPLGVFTAGVCWLELEERPSLITSRGLLLRFRWTPNFISS